MNAALDLAHPTSARKTDHRLATLPPFAADDLPNFHLPPELEASEPPEARGLSRDGVRLMVSYRSDNRIAHSRFYALPDFLEPGDLLVINTSATLKAAVDACRADGQPLVIHLSTRLPAGLEVVEVRQPDKQASRSFLRAIPGEILTLPGGAAITLLTPYLPSQRREPTGAVRLWIASIKLPGPGSLYDYLAGYGRPIRYSYVKTDWPIDYYQTVYATEPGSAEMPSAGRAFTPELITRLVALGVELAPLVLHTGVASLEKSEPPYEEFYRVPVETARRVNAARAAGKRVVAVGTTTVRALETVTDEAGLAHPAQGWTDLVITPERGLRGVNALLTGLHEPEATHMAMLQTLAGLDHLRLAYGEALQKRYLWHEFGDLHLILP